MISFAVNQAAAPTAAAKTAGAFEWPGQAPASKIAPSPWDFVTLPEQNRATARQHAQIACGSGDMPTIENKTC